MKVILKQDVEKVGRRGDIVNVAPGYGRNYLIPRKLALEVTPSNMKLVEIERAALKKKTEAERQSFQSLIGKLNEVTLVFTRRSGERDVIFGSVSAQDIKEALAEKGFDIDRKKIILDEPIKRLGHFSVPVKVHHEDRAEVKIVVAKDESGAEEAIAEGPAADAGTKD
ncbi:MAG: 50S ribosomal protein L9 [Candidatus Aminicenantes bacterium]|nr:50S ribosomal protein L9 [Candidatus Aminicenantes bacterium]